MKDQLVSFETAISAKEKGFDEWCDFYYCQEFGLDNTSEDNNTTISKRGKDHCIAPTQSLLQKWLREKHNIHVNCEISDISTNTYLYSVKWYEKFFKEQYGGGKNYEDALENGLKQALNIINHLIK